MNLDKDLYALEGRSSERKPNKEQELAEPELRLQNQGITQEHLALWSRTFNMTDTCSPVMSSTEGLRLPDVVTAKILVYTF